MIGKKKHALHESTKNFLSYEWEITVKFQFSVILYLFRFHENMRQSSKIYHKKNGFRFPEKLVIKLFLV